MLYQIFGLPGSGKTYCTLENYILPALENGTIVLSNIKLQDNLELENYLFLTARDLHNLKNLWKTQLDNDLLDIDVRTENLKQAMFDYIGKKSQILFVIDEAHLFGFAGTRTKENKFLEDFVSIHRHLCVSSDKPTDLILITQTTNRILPTIQAQTELAIKCMSSTERVQKNLLEFHIYSGVEALKKKQTDLRVQRILKKGNPKIFDMYRGGAKIEGHSGVRRRLYLIIIMIITASVFIAYNMWSIFNSGVSKKQIKQKKVDTTLQHKKTIQKKVEKKEYKIVYRTYKKKPKVLPKNTLFGFYDEQKHYVLAIKIITR